MKKQFFFRVLIVFVFIVVVPIISVASIVVLNGLTHEMQLKAGETYRGTIQVQNASVKNKSVKIYQRDYWFSYTGESKHDLPGTMKRSNANWISVNPELVEISPNEVVSVNFEVKVPENDSLSGTYWSVIMVEGIVPPDTTNFKKGVTINTAIRYAVQIATNIGDKGVRDIQFLGLDMIKQEDIPFLYVALENTGEWLLRPELKIELFDEQGTSKGIIKAERRKIYPGTSVLSALRLEAIKPGKYKGVIIADCDDDHIFGTNVSIEIE